MQFTEIDFQKARENVSSRPKFLAGLDLEGVGKYLRVKYLHEDSKEDRAIKGAGGPPLMIMRYHMNPIVPFKKRTLFVFPNSFQYSESLDDFNGYALDHEGQHAKELFWFPWVVNISDGERFVRGFSEEQLTAERIRRLANFEVRAYNNQQRNLLSRPKHSDKYLKNIQEGLTFWGRVAKGETGLVDSDFI